MLCTLANEAKSGNKDAMAQIIEKFNPLLKKYSRKLEYEDAYNDLVLFFIELIYKIPDQIIASFNDGKLVKYISICIKNHHYYLLKKNTFSVNEINISEMSDEQKYYLESSSSVIDESNAENIFFILKDFLAPNELQIIILIYYFGYTSAEIARKEKTTRQAVNQLKQRALHKIKKNFYKDL